MEVGKSLSRERASRLGWSHSFGLTNSLRAVWWLFTSVRFAIGLLALLAVVTLVGVLIPQLPLAVRGDAVAEAAWLKSEEDTFGFLTAGMHRVGLFNIFHQDWFAALLALTALSTGAYVVSRFAGIWRAISNPRKRVPDRYFEMAPNRLTAESPLDVAKLETMLRRARYRVERFEEPVATYLFADRLQWAQLATLLTHAAVIVFILSAVVRQIDAFSSPLFLAEGSTLPVFPVRDSNQMQVELVNAHGSFASDGQPLDYRSDLVIYRRGEEVKRCQSTVNSPCSYGGYRFYQSAYFGFGAAVQVRDLATDNVIYRETLALSDRTPSPHVVVKDASGQTLLDESLVLTDSLDTGEIVYNGTLVSLPNTRLLSIGLQRRVAGGDERLAVLEPGEGDVVRLSLAEGETAEAAGLKVSYLRNGAAPSASVPDLPLPPGARGAATSKTRLQLSNVIYGTATASEGARIEVTPMSGPPRLTIVGLRPQAATLGEGESVTIDGYEYTFSGQREFAGITVKRDRSDLLVWIAALMIVIGLTVTFWVPRRRLWAKITETQTYLAGQAPAHANYARELRSMARQAGATVPEETDDDD